MSEIVADNYQSFLNKDIKKLQPLVAEISWTKNEEIAKRLEGVEL
jgi:hypothetical protein